MSEGFAYFACFLGGLIFGGAWVSYHLKKQLAQLAEMVVTIDKKKDQDKKKDPADWWKGEEDD